VSAALHAGFAVGLLHPGMAAPQAILSATASGREQRYAVYRNNATMALVHAFESGYPVVRALLGEDCFLQLARDCARLHPPRTPVMAEYVGLLPCFLDGTPLAAALPYLVDVARLEAACLQVFHAADGDALPASAWLDLQADPARLARACVSLQPACAWMPCAHAAADLWLAHMRAAQPELAELEGIDVEAAQDVLVWRDPAGRVLVAALPSGCASALDALQAGEPLLRALSTLPPQACAALLAHLAGDGLAVAVRIDPDHFVEAS
jgi:hypothetical protein